jgi:NitT/TauT family transport system permease protein
MSIKTSTDDRSDLTEAETTEAPTGARPRARGGILSGNVIPPVILGAFVVAGWYGITYGLLDARRRFLLKPPHEVIAQGFLDWSTFSEMLSGLWSSTQVAMIGLAISIGIGFLFATVMSQAKMIERAVFPFMVTLQAIPILAIVPLISFWWGTGQRSRIIVCVIISLFPIIVNTLFGLQSAERGMHDLFTLHHANRLTRLRKLMFPAALPAIFAGLRISAGLSVIGAIVGDFFFGRGDVGIGQLLRRYANQLMGEELLAAVILSSALGVTVFMTFGWLQTIAIGKWHETSGGGA